MAEIKNLKKAAEKILKAVEKKKDIVLYGDADLDGVSAVIILKEAIQTLGGKVTAVYFPDREIEGYGITETGLRTLVSKAPALFVALDCGIGNFKEVELARKMGFEVIIVDHHKILDKLPKADIIVNPKQKGEKYPFSDFAASGLSFLLASAILKDKMKGSLRQTLLELAALATLADMMPKEADNEIMIEEGLSSLENSFRPGIKAFLETESVLEQENLNHKVSKIISTLNTRDVKDGLPASYRLLTSSNLGEAKKMAEDLLKKGKLRKEVVEITLDEVKKRLAGKTEPVIFEGDPSFDLILLSSVASILVKEYKKPTFLYKKMEKESHGTVRSPSAVDSVELMKKCSEHLLTFGGHPRASGFRLKNENLEKFKECLMKNCK
jgi:single-stranded-DNA-specific exonuclease